MASDDETEVPSNEELEESTPAEPGQIIIILEGAQLETVKTKKGEFQLMNCDDHLNLIRKHNKDPQLFRPDIVHQVFWDPESLWF